MAESTELGQDKEKVQALAIELWETIELFYPEDKQPGLAAFEQLDALALVVVGTVRQMPPQLYVTMKRYFSLRLSEIDSLALEDWEKQWQSG